MALGSLGYVTVTTAGTPVRATANATSPTKRIAAQAANFQALPDNTGIIYIGLEGMDKTTGVGVLGLVPAPTDPLVGPFPSWGASQPLLQGAWDMSKIYIDADTSGEGVVVSYTQG